DGGPVAGADQYCPRGAADAAGVATADRSRRGTGAIPVRNRAFHAVLRRDLPAATLRAAACQGYRTARFPELPPHRTGPRVLRGRAGGGENLLVDGGPLDRRGARRRY